MLSFENMTLLVKCKNLFLVCSAVMILMTVWFCTIQDITFKEHCWPSANATDMMSVVTNLAKLSRGGFVVGSELLTQLRRPQSPKKHHSTANNTYNTITADDVVFIVMGSVAERQRVQSQRASWMRWTRHVFIFADANDADLGMITLPEIENKTGFAEAQYRQLHGMKWLLSEKPAFAAKKWFFLVDDDTWVNVPLLLSFCSQYSFVLPLSFSHIYRMYNGQAVYNGGAGMLFTNTAFHLLANGVLTEACPLTDVDPGFVNNDNILAACAYSTGVLKITSSKFSTYEGILHMTGDILDTGWLDQITVHKIREQPLSEKMYCWSQRVWGDSDSFCRDWIMRPDTAFIFD